MEGTSTDNGPFLPLTPGVSVETETEILGGPDLANFDLGGLVDWWDAILVPILAMEDVETDPWAFWKFWIFLFGAISAISGAVWFLSLPMIGVMVDCWWRKPK